MAALASKQSQSAFTPPSAKYIDEKYFMAQYVYIFFEPAVDPKQNKVFYVGKGTGNRPKGHLTQSGVSAAVASDDESSVVEAGAHPENLQVYELERGPTQIEIEAMKTRLLSESKVQCIQRLSKDGVTPKQMIRVIAQDLDDSLSSTLESFAIHHVFGIANLKNIAAGKHSERFRSFSDWKPTTYWLAGDKKDLEGRYYVYVLRNPGTGAVVYVGKGKDKRLLAHSRELAKTSEEGRTDKHKALADIEADGHKAEDIARVIAYDLDEGEAYAIESFAMKFVYGGTTNAVRGHESFRFRAKGDWELRLGFDLPFLVAKNASKASLMELDSWRGEGLVKLLESVISPVTHVTWNADAINFAAGSCAVYAVVLGPDQSERGTLYVHARSPKRATITVEIRFENKTQKEWGTKTFGPSGFNHVIRRHDRSFFPDAWTNSPAPEPAEATNRVRWMLALLQTDSKSALTKVVGENVIKELLGEDIELRKRLEKTRRKRSEKKTNKGAIPKESNANELCVDVEGEDDDEADNSDDSGGDNAPQRSPLGGSVVTAGGHAQLSDGASQLVSIEVQISSMGSETGDTKDVDISREGVNRIEGDSAQTKMIGTSVGDGSDQQPRPPGPIDVRLPDGENHFFVAVSEAFPDIDWTNPAKMAGGAIGIQGNVGFENGGAGCRVIVFLGKRGAQAELRWSNNHR